MEQLKEYYKIISMVWKLLKDFYPRQPRDDAYWKDYAAALGAEEFTSRKDCRFFIDLVGAVTDELHRTAENEVAWGYPSER